MRVRFKLAVLAVGVLVVLGLTPQAWAVEPLKVSGTRSGNQLLVDCGTFEIWDEFELNFEGTLHFDRLGNVVRIVEHIWGVDRLYNPENGASISGSFNQGEIVQPLEGEVAVNGIIFRISVPGAGAVFLDLGRFVFTFDGGLVFAAGQHDFFAGDIAGLCDALA